MWLNIVNPVRDWPLLLHTLTDHDYNLGQDDHWVCPHMSHDFDLHLTFDLDVGVNAKFGGHIFYASRKFEYFTIVQYLYWDLSNKGNVILQIL